MGDIHRYDHCPKCHRKMYEGPRNYPGFVDGVLQDGWFFYHCPGCDYEEKMILQDMEAINYEKR